MWTLIFVIKSTGYEWVECLNLLNLLITHLWYEHAFPCISWVSQDDFMLFPWKLQPEVSVLASRLGIERNPLIQCASRLGDQDQLMLEAWNQPTNFRGQSARQIGHFWHKLDTFDTFEVSERFSSSTQLQSIAQSIAKDLESLHETLLIFAGAGAWCKETLARLRKIRFCWQADGVKRHQETLTEVFPWGLRRHFWRQETI